MAEVVCVGESMVTFLPSVRGPLADVPSFARTIGGAESNVACALAASGHRTRWISRVGADGFGDHLVAAIGSYGVDVSAVRRDPGRPTGIYFRTAGDRASAAHEVAYYRAGSAASAMSTANMPLDVLACCRILHLSGITAALSADCAALVRTLTRRRPGRPLVSFDVNHRPRLWQGSAEGPEALLAPARGADLVFVGEDEAADAWGVRGADAIRRALPEPETVVVKRGAAGAVMYTRDGAGDGRDRVVPVPALRVDVVAEVGAGDAFAAGVLSATLRGLPPELRLRHGHLMAAAVLTVEADVCVPPPRAALDRLAALDAGAWARLRPAAGWTGTRDARETERP
jgi:2-dehydro-3-deoxygluconokinase